MQAQSRIKFFGTKTKVDINGSSLRQDKFTFDYRKVVNIYIVYEISKNINISDYPTLKNCLFSAVSFTKNVTLISTNILNMELDLVLFYFKFYSNTSGGTGRNIITFEVDMSSSIKIYNGKKYILIRSKDPPQGLDHILTAE